MTQLEGLHAPLHTEERGGLNDAAQLLTAVLHRTLGVYFDAAPGWDQFDVLSPATNIPAGGAPTVVLDTTTAATVPNYTPELWTENRERMIVRGVAVTSPGITNVIWRVYVDEAMVFVADHNLTADGILTLHPLRVVSDGGSHRIRVTGVSAVAEAGCRVRVSGYFGRGGPLYPGRDGAV